MAAAPSDGLGKVIELPVKPRSCFTCENARFPEHPEVGTVTFCAIYREVIDSELYAAEDCFTYDHCAEGSQPVEADLDLELM